MTSRLTSYPVAWWGAASASGLPGEQPSPSRHVTPRKAHGLEVDLQITNRCPLTCEHCVYDSSMHAGEGLSLATIEVLCAEFRALGVEQVSITGGEPLLRRDLTSAVRLIADHAMEVCVQTSGVFVHRTDFAALGASGVSLLLVSIDGLATFHDQFRHRRGLFDDALEAIKRSAAAGIPVRVNVVVSRPNRGDAVALLPVLRDMGVGIVSFFYLSPVGRGAQRKEDVLSFSEWAEFEQQVGDWCVHHAPVDGLSVKVQRVATPMARIPAGGQVCRIRDRDNILILANGDVYPCVFLCEQSDLRLGNIFESPLGSIWRTAEAWRTAYQPLLASSGRDCAGGPANHCSGGCPAFRRLLRQPAGYCDTRCEHDGSTLVPDCAREYSRLC
jgi:radical SAM protein with 4Fe4S-binding SPASM domain